MASTPKETNVDVLISGAGPAGMMASMYLSEMGISHRIVDQRGTRTLTGRADGFHVRTIEIWESFGMANKIRDIGPRYRELAIWSFGDEYEGVKRVQRQDIASSGEGRIEPMTMHQGYIEAAFIEGVKQRGGPIVERGTRPISIDINTNQVGDQDAYPVAVSIRHSLMSELDPARTGAHSIENGTSKPERGFIDAYGLDPEEIVQHVSGEEGTIETIHAKYLIGTDGAHSFVRRQLPDFKMEGDNTDAVYGVIDIIPHTNFPDVRKVCSILSRAGFCLLIPRESNLIRLYVQFPEGWSEKGKSTVPNQGDPSICAEILDAARKIFAPYTMDYKYCDWWTVYRVGQRVCNHASYLDRVFLAGDAVHTHSPKGGQGMNVSTQDSYNLAWKIAGVLNKQLHPSVLSTYESERIPVARDLIDLDKYMAGLLNARANRDEQEVMKMYEKLVEFNGTKLNYKRSMIQAADGEIAEQEAAKGLSLGMRVPDTKVYSQSQGNAIYSQSLIKSNGLWRLLVFAGDLSDVSRRSAINAMGDKIVKLVQRYAPASSRQSNWMEVLLFHNGRTSDIEITDLHDAYFPQDEVLGRNYFNVVGDFPGLEFENSVHAKGAHEEYEIHKQRGALVIVRPDQVIAWVGYLDDLEKAEQWLETFMLPRADGKRTDSGRASPTAVVGESQ